MGLFAFRPRVVAEVRRLVPAWPWLNAALACLLSAPVAVQADATGFLERSVRVDGVSYRSQVHVPADYTPKKSWPVLLFLHGSGERGEDGVAQTQVGLPAAIRQDPGRFPVIAVLPQARPNTRWSGAMAKQALRALERSIAEFHGDRRRVYLTGLSMGGQGVWLLAASHPSKFAALAPVCGFIRIEGDDDVIDEAQDRALLAQYPQMLSRDPYAGFARRIGRTPAWIFHGAVDDVVPVEQARALAQAMGATGAEVRFSEYAGVNHGAWDRAYAEPDLLRWLLSHRLGQR